MNMSLEKHSILNRKGTVLVVDDEAFVCEITKMYLEEENYLVFTTTDPSSALEIVDEIKVDLIITDMKMPKVTGKDILNHVREKYPETPVIMFTGVTDVNIAVSIMKMGAYNYLVKPIRKDELLFAVKKGIEYRQLLMRNKFLFEENYRYQHELETRIKMRTRELAEALFNLKVLHMDTVKVLASTIEEKDPYTRGHANRVRIYAKELSKRLGYVDSEIEKMEYGALLHDIGKIAVSQEILDKPGPLSKIEIKIVREHPLIGERIVSKVSFFDNITPIVRWHHERWDGNGYPDRLESHKIPQSARILGLVDAFDAMTSNRPYRNAIPLHEVCDIIEKEKGKQFDPEIADLFLKEKIYKVLVQE